MKKLAILVGAIALTGSTFAQKATTDNPFSLEGSLNYSNGSGIDWSAPTIRMRYFLNDNIAGRLQIGLGDGQGTPASESYTFYENGDGTGASGTSEIKRSQWMAQLGAEYHLAGTDRMSPYFALGLNFGGGSYNESWANSDGSSYVDGLSAEVAAKYSMFGVGLGAGMDFYVFENVYLGVELGLNYGSYNYSDATVDVTTPAGTVNSVEPGYKETYTGTGAANAAFRLGWRF